jgi:DnaJ family protein B protein 4
VGVLPSDRRLRHLYLLLLADVDIQPGWRKGTKIRFPHLGNERKGELPQDIVFVIEEIPHDRFTRVGSDLVTEAEISLAEALACDGGVYKLVDLDGRYVKIPLPTGIIRPGDETKVVGRGLPIRKAGKIIGKGDIIVK